MSWLLYITYMYLFIGLIIAGIGVTYSPVIAERFDKIGLLLTFVSSFLLVCIVMIFWLPVLLYDRYGKKNV